MREFEPTLATWWQRVAHRWLLAALVLLLLAALWVLVLAPQRAAPPAATQPAPKADAAAIRVEAENPAASATFVEVAVLRQVLASGPLAGTQLDGEFRCDGAGGMVPDPGVRRRFDYYAQGLGDADQALRVTRDDIARLVGDDAHTACGAQAADQARQLWLAYSSIELPLANAAASELAALKAALEQRRALRIQALGPKWAPAFFGDDDAAEVAASARSARGVPAATAAALPVRDIAAEAALQAQWADWDRRIAAASAELQQISIGSAQPTPAQITALLDHWFSATERARAAAVLGLPVYGG
ncbi:MAG: lipase secretion chaperone [Burkholderiaceae bacterium]